MLAADRLVEMRPRRSPIVARLDVRDLVEMNQIRGALEPLILADAVDRHTEETLAECEAVLVSARRVRDPMELVELNKAFHMSLLGPTRMQRSLDIVADQYDGIARLTQYRVIAHGDLPGELIDEHLNIFATVRKRLTDAAVSLMAAHISSATARAKAELAQKGHRGRGRKSGSRGCNARLNSGRHEDAMQTEFDYIVAGAGSAGAIVAARLAEHDATSVLLLEAGPKDRSLLFHVPAAMRYAYNVPKYNWNYVTEPEPFLNGRILVQPRGKVLGGSSSINGQLYLRGHPLDYDGWGRRRCEGLVLCRGSALFPAARNPRRWKFGVPGTRGAASRRQQWAAITR